MANITPDQLRGKLAALKSALSEVRGKAEVAGIQTLRADMERRVFNNGRGTDRPLGPYRSAAYKRFRANRKRQTAYKDLELTGQLRRDLIVGELGDNAVLGFRTDRSAKIADYQEEQLNIFIWRPNSDELKRMLNAMVKTINKELIKALS